MDVFVHKNGQDLGPFSEPRVRAGIESGEFATNDVGWREGLDGWLPLSQLIPPVRATAMPAISSAPAGNATSFSTALGGRVMAAATAKSARWNSCFLLAVLIFSAVVFFAGFIYGAYRTTQMGGVVFLDGDLATQFFITAGPSVIVSIDGTSGSNPDQVIVDFKNTETGKIMSSETLNVETGGNGKRKFSFHRQEDTVAVIHRP